MVDALGIAPSSSALQTDADLSQLNVREIVSSSKFRVPSFHLETWNSELETEEVAGPNGLEPSSSSSTGKCIRLSATAP